MKIDFLKFPFRNFFIKKHFFCKIVDVQFFTKDALWYNCFPRVCDGEDESVRTHVLNKKKFVILEIIGQGV